MQKISPIWPCLAPFGPVWHCMPQFDPVLHYFLKNDVELIIKDHPKKKDIPKKEEKLRNGGNTKNSDDPIKMTQKCGIPQIEDKKTNKTPKN